MKVKCLNYIVEMNEINIYGGSRFIRTLKSE